MSKRILTDNKDTVLCDTEISYNAQIRLLAIFGLKRPYGVRIADDNKFEGL